MDREKNLVKNTLIITIGKICTQLITFLLLPLYTGILTTEEYGTVDLLNTLVLLLLPIITFQAEQAVFRELIESRNDTNRIKKIISSGIFSVILQCCVFVLISLLITTFIHISYMYFLVLNVIASIMNSLLLQIARGLGNNAKYAMGSFLSALFTIIFNILFLVVFKLGIIGMLLGTLMGQVMGFIYLFIVLKIPKYLSASSFDKNMVGSLWKYSFPLIPNAISWWIFNASDRVIVSTLLGLSFNGILSAASKFSAVYITLYNIFNMSWTESISLHIHDDDIKEYFNKMFNIMLNFFSALSIGLIACMPFVYPIMINTKFQDGYELVPILIIASFFNVIVGLVSVLYIANKNTKAIANTSIISAIINIVVHLLLIKYIGLYAAALSTFASFFIMACYRLIDVKKRYFEVKIDLSRIISTLIIAGITILCYYINNPTLNLMSLLIAIIYAWVSNKDSINIMKIMIQNKIKKA